MAPEGLCFRKPGARISSWLTFCAGYGLPSHSGTMFEASEQATGLVWSFIAFSAFRVRPMDVPVTGAGKTDVAETQLSCRWRVRRDRSVRGNRARPHAFRRAILRGADPVDKEFFMHHDRPAFRATFLPLALAAGLCAGGPAMAQHSPALDRASFWIGGFYAASDTTLHARTLDGSNNGDVHLEKDLGFRRRAWTPRLHADVLVGDSQGFSFDYYRYRRERGTRIANSITYQGVTYDAQASVQARLGFDFGSAAYRWWFGSGRDVVGIGLGAGYYRVDASIRGQGTLNGIVGLGAVSGQAESSTDASAWAPLLQLGWRHAFGDHWRLYLDASGVKKNGGRLYGHVYRAAFGAQWFPLRHLGISAEYGVNRIRLWRHNANYDDSLDLKLDGPSVFATLRF
jgi:hypothetical protein